MVTVHDVAAYILEKCGAMSSMKLQKLVYYSKAWHMVWADEEMFYETFEAWANGPVVFELYDIHRGKFEVQPPWAEGDASNLTAVERESIDLVIKSYGPLSGRQLSALTHQEGPWKNARNGLDPSARSATVITAESMHEFYAALDVDDSATAVSDIDWSTS